MNVFEKKPVSSSSADLTAGGGELDVIKLVAVADGARISLNLVLNILVARKAFPQAEFHVALPKTGNFGDALAEKIITKYAKEIYTIPDPAIVIDDNLYRLENKINALKYFTDEPAILVDSDTIFLRPLPKRFLFRGVPAATPEHGLHVYPWERLFSLVGLECPDFHVILGSGEEGLPWLNAGLVVVPNAAKFGYIWKMMADYVLQCEWVPERWPYLDQIALPLALAQYSPERSLSHANILPNQFNQNIFYWAGDQSVVRGGFMVHHHGRVRLLKRYVPDIFAWMRAEYPEVDIVLEKMGHFDRDD